MLKRFSRFSGMLDESIDDIDTALDNVSDKEANSVVEDVIYHADQYIRDFYDDSGFKYTSGGDIEKEPFVEDIMKNTDAVTCDYRIAWFVDNDIVDDEDIWPYVDIMVEELEDRYDCKLEFDGRGYLILNSLPQQRPGNYIIEVPKRVWKPKQAFYQLYNLLDDWGYIESYSNDYDDIAELVDEVFNKRYEDRSTPEGVLSEGPWVISDNFLNIMRKLDKDIKKGLARFKK